MNVNSFQDRENVIPCQALLSQAGQELTKQGQAHQAKTQFFPFINFKNLKFK